MRMKIFSASLVVVLVVVLFSALIVAGTYQFGHWDTTAMSLVFNLAVVLCAHKVQTRYYRQTVAVRMFSPWRRHGFLFALVLLLEVVAVFFSLILAGTAIAQATKNYNTFMHGVVQ